MCLHALVPALHLGHKAGADREFMRGQPHSLTCDALLHAIHLIENTPRLHHHDPKLWASLPFPHTRFCRLFGDWFVREDTNPHFATTTDMACHGYTTSFNLSAGNPGRFKRLQGILPETDLRPVSCRPIHPSTVLFPKSRLFRHQHRSGIPSHTQNPR